MQAKNDISEELRLLSAVVEGIGRQTPYKVPQGYFEGFSGILAGRLYNESSRSLPADEAPEISPVPDPGQELPFALPEGYFEGFMGTLMGRIRSEEENAYSALLNGIGKKIPYQAPEGYFENLTGEVVNRIRMESGDAVPPLLDRIGRKMPFQMPEGYFNELTANVLSGVRAIGYVNDELGREAEEMAPLLKGLRDKQVYQAPEGYFSELPALILARLEVPAVMTRPAPVMTAMPVAAGKLFSMRPARNWLKYSAAAVMAGLILSVGWLRLHPHTSPPVAVVTPDLTKATDQEIQNYLDNDNDANAPLADVTSNSTATLDITDGDVKNMLADISDDELNQYLDDNGAKNLTTN